MPEPPARPPQLHGGDLSVVAARHRADGPLLLDVDQPAVRAVLALLVELKNLEDDDGGWNGGDTVDTVTRWLARIGLDPDHTLDHIAARLPRDHVAARLAAVVAAGPGQLERARDIDLDRVAWLVRAAGVECVVQTPGEGVAVLVAGPPSAVPGWAFPWSAYAGPGRFRGDSPSTATVAELVVGPDDGGVVEPTSAARVGATTEEQVAALVVAQVRILDSGSPLTVAELRAAGLTGHA